MAKRRKVTTVVVNSEQLAGWLHELVNNFAWSLGEPVTYPRDLKPPPRGRALRAGKLAP